MTSHRGHPDFYKILDEMRDLHDRKNANYAEDGNPLSNFLECEKFGVPAYLGTLVRMSDKFSRLQQLAKGKKDEVGESMRDTLLDLAVYCILDIILYEQHIDKKVKK